MQRTAYYKNFPDEAPSAAAQPAKFRDIQADPKIQIFCNRPRSVTSNPITLLHPIFGKFDDDSKNFKADPEISSFVQALTVMMADFYDDEAQRALSFRKLIYDHFKIKLEAANVATTPYTTDGHVSIGFHVYLNSEAKNEAGSTPADSSIQSAICYHYHIRPFASSMVWSRFPCIHIYYFGKEF
jgi:hypothetical protein